MCRLHRSQRAPGVGTGHNSTSVKGLLQCSLLHYLSISLPSFSFSFHFLRCSSECMPDHFPLGLHRNCKVSGVAKSVSGCSSSCSFQFWTSQVSPTRHRVKRRLLWVRKICGFHLVCFSCLPASTRLNLNSSVCVELAILQRNICWNRIENRTSIHNESLWLSTWGCGSPIVPKPQPNAYGWQLEWYIRTLPWHELQLMVEMESLF